MRDNFIAKQTESHCWRLFTAVNGGGAELNGQALRPAAGRTRVARA